MKFSLGEFHMTSGLHSYFIGLGALRGAFAAQVLKHNPQEIKIIAHGDRAKKLHNGIYVNDIHFPLSITDSPLDIADTIIIAVKYPQLEEAIEDIKPIVALDTLLIS